jgi:hypothetical protein
MGCAAEHGMFDASYSVEGPVRVDALHSDAALALFVLRLIDRLRHIATVPAMDILAYAKTGIQTTSA